MKYLQWIKRGWDIQPLYFKWIQIVLLVIAFLIGLLGTMGYIPETIWR